MNIPGSQRCAIIDLGSNSARLIVMRYVPGQSYHLEDEIREIVRLREGMTEQGLSEAAMTRGLLTLRLFKQFCESLGVTHIIATATSAVREAANGELFLQRVQQELGFRPRLLNGEQEAYYGVQGALNAVALRDGVIIDIGGGSAQVSRIQDRSFVEGEALTLGALALTERFVRSDPIKKTELAKVEAEISRQLDGVAWLKREHGPLVGLGGTIRNLAKIEATRRKFPLESINGFTLTRAALDETIYVLSANPLAQRKRIPGLSKDRADIILPGALVLRAVVERLGVGELSISEFGLREGLFFDHFWRDIPSHLTPDLREFSVLSLGRFYGFHETHAKHVCHLATCLFERLQPLHCYGEWEADLLAAAALLHDIGLSIKYNDHHKYSQLLIAGNALPGYSSREVALIALLARFHRKGTPSVGEYAPLLKEGDELRLTRLSALLRLAEFLERSRTHIVSDVVAKWDKKQLNLELIASEYPAVELWGAQRGAVELLEAAFGRSVTVESRAKRVV